MPAIKNLKSSKVKLASAELGLLFHEVRKSCGMSLETVSRYMGNVTPDRINQYEKGLMEIPLCDIYALANCLNIPPDNILKLIEKLNPTKKRP